MAAEVAIRKGDHIVPWIAGCRLRIRRGMTGATGNLYAGLHEFEEMGFIAHLLRENEVFVDIGANVGSYSVLAAFVPHARVVAYEPARAAFNALSANVALNDLATRVEAHNAAVGATCGTAKITQDLDTVNHIADGDEASDEVPLTTLDAAVRDHGVTAMKIDVEGFEHEVLAGAAGILAQQSLLGVVIELNGSGARYGFVDADIDAALLARGFSRVSYDPMAREIADAGPEVVGRGNVIYVRNRSEAVRRLKSARPIEVLGRSI